ncbi:ROK family transcriptional regulator [Xylanibacillus composti]|uniref:N-acetylglucosamine repressor n=1 Tax=Xylanibacillus composti TaxID=1572762 RepID=A0A8J4GZR3_9BACL|nr:ROK family transcriptional regulator [Xylanibacillus composti]MDT9724963.1 ROK family transcriptional regulator [Xylanibacillus composti]GIQ68203.1 N-acetylglucosamine repressor [Xylanibacillus composti]
MVVQTDGANKRGTPATAKASLIKDINTAAVLGIVREQEMVSRADIAKTCGLTPATVSSIVSDLLELGIVRETGSGTSSGGRKPTMIALNERAWGAIGLDLGPRQIHAGIVDLHGKAVHDEIVPLPADRSEAAILGLMDQVTDRLLKWAASRSMRMVGLGIGAHGLVDPNAGVSLYAPAFQWKQVAVREWFNDRYELPVMVDNDARAMAAGEKWFGAAQQAESFVFLNVGTGIGSGIYLNGQLLYGAHFGAGEIGHIPISDDSQEICYCGKRGCLSTFASGPALEKRARIAVRQGADSLLEQLSAGKPERITGQLIHQAAMQGDELAVRLLRETGEHIGSALAMMVNVVNPDMILIGGGVSEAGEFLFHPIRETVRKEAMAVNTERLSIMPGQLGAVCGVVGAATLLLQEVFAQPKTYLTRGGTLI